MRHATVSPDHGEPSLVAPGLKIIGLADIDTQLQAQWAELAASAAEPNYFNRPEYLLPALRHCDPEGRAALALLYDHERLTGLMPVARHGHYGRWPISYFGNWLHHNAFLGTPLLLPGHEERFWEALLDHCDRNRTTGSFLHLEKLALDGMACASLQAVCVQQRRACDIVQAEQRALRHSPLDGPDYYAATVRKKKRKELNRLRNRLAEEGALSLAEGIEPDGLDGWIDEFLALEADGWKGRNGSSLASHDDTRALFREALHAAHGSASLHLAALRLDGMAIAMLVTFLSAPGGFSFKTAFDENYARFSPGVLLQIDMMGLAGEHRLDWIDSCAAEGHPMIDSLWGERRTVGRISVALRSGTRPLAFRALRTGEQAMARIRAASRGKSRSTGAPSE
ncbi:MAG: GNAT family N-acetyltransferase [Blastomonas sp.]